MKSISFLMLFWVMVLSGYGETARSIRDFGVNPLNTAQVNARHLQNAIDWASTTGAALYVEPSDKPYPIDGGIILKRNVSLVGAHGPTGRGTANPAKNGPVGSVFAITDKTRPFIVLESSTQIKGVQFYYPEQGTKSAREIVNYFPTIQVKANECVQGVTLSSLTFYGEYQAIDFVASEQFPCEQVLIEHCYGYSLSGEFIKIQHCSDVPRILHCHVNPYNMREFQKSFTKEMIEAVIEKKAFAFTLDFVNNAQVIDIFTYGVYGGINLGAYSYGQLSHFNFDCVSVGIYRNNWAEPPKNNKRNSKIYSWMISQGAIVANVGKSFPEIMPIILECGGHTSLSNIDCSSGKTTDMFSFDQCSGFLFVKGKDRMTVSVVGCHMRDINSVSGPIQVSNPNATVDATACFYEGSKYSYMYPR